MHKRSGYVRLVGRPGIDRKVMSADTWAAWMMLVMLKMLAMMATVLTFHLKKRKSLNSQMLSTSRMSLKPAVPSVLSPFHVFDAAKTPAPRFSCDIIPVDLEYIHEEVLVPR